MLNQRKKQQAQEQLLQAIKNNDLPAIKQAIKSGAVVNKKDKNGRTALFIAAQNGNVAIIRYLAKKCRAKVDLTDDCGRTALFIAAQNGHATTVACLVKEFGAQVDLADDFGTTPLLTAIQKCHVETVMCLIKECKANVNLPNNKDRTTILLIAAQKGRIDIGSLLTNDRATPLLIAVQKGRLDIASLLINNGAEITKDVAKIAKEKIYAGIVMKYENQERLKKQEEKERRKRLQKLIVPSEEQKQLVRRIIIGDLEAIKEAIKNGANINEEDRSGFTSLHIAAQKGRKAIVEYLIKELGFDVNLSTNNGRTALYFASCGGYIEIVKYLVKECKADVDLATDFGETPLLVALQEGRQATARYLIEGCGANVNLQNEDEVTPLLIALQKGYGSMEKLLMDYGAKITKDVAKITKKYEEEKKLSKQQQKDKAEKNQIKYNSLTSIFYTTVLKNLGTALISYNLISLGILREYVSVNVVISEVKFLDESLLIPGASFVENLVILGRKYIKKSDFESKEEIISKLPICVLQIQKLAEKVARELTLKYSQQIKNLGSFSSDKFGKDITSHIILHICHSNNERLLFASLKAILEAEEFEIILGLKDKGDELLSEILRETKDKSIGSALATILTNPKCFKENEFLESLGKGYQEIKDKAQQKEFIKAVIKRTQELEAELDQEKFNNNPNEKIKDLVNCVLRNHKITLHHYLENPEEALKQATNNNQTPVILSQIFMQNNPTQNGNSSQTPSSSPLISYYTDRARGLKERDLKIVGGNYTP